MTRYVLWIAGSVGSFAGVIPGMPIAYWAGGLVAAGIVGCVSAVLCWVCLGWVETIGWELGRARRRQMPRARVVVDWEGGL